MLRKQGREIRKGQREREIEKKRKIARENSQTPIRSGRLAKIPMSFRTYPPATGSGSTLRARGASLLHRFGQFVNPKFPDASVAFRILFELVFTRIQNGRA